MPSRLAQHLVSQGLLPPEKANEALRRHAVAGGLFDTALLEQGVVSEPGLLNALSETAGVQKVNLADFEPNPEVASFIPPKLAERLCAVPLSLDGSTLHVACGYPVPKAELDEVGFLLGKQLVLWVALEVRIRDWIATIYKAPLPARYANLLAQLDPTRPVASAPEPEPEGLTPQFVERLAQAVVEEPIPLEVRKRPAGEGAPPQTAASIRRALTPPEFKAPGGGAPQAAARPPVASAPADPRPSPVPPPQGGPAPARAAPPSAQPSSSGATAPPAQTRPAPPPAPQAPPPARAAPSPPPQQSAPPQQPAPPQQSAPPQSTAAASPPPARAVQPSPPASAPQTRPAPVSGTQPAVASPRTAPAAAPQAPSQAPPTAPVRPAPQPPAQPAAAQPRPIPSAPPPGARPLGSALPPSTQTATQTATAGAASVEASVPDSIPDWTLAQAREHLAKATRDRDELITVALRFARRTFDFVAAFAVIRGAAVGWDVRGEGTERARVQQVSIPLDTPSVFRTVTMSRGSYVGPLPSDGLTRHFVEQFGRAPRALFLFPVEVKGRLVALVYGDNGPKSVSQLRLSELLLFCQDLPSAFQELIYLRKKRAAPGSTLKEAEASLQIFEAVDVDVAEFKEPESVSKAPAGLGWSPFGASSTSGVGRAISLPGMGVSEGERPPPDFGPLLQRLTGPDAVQRARAIAELARTPEASARALAAAFPGPSAWSRLPVEELPEADELGPIPGALARLGRPAALALAPLLDSEDSDARYLALLTAGNLPYAELVEGILRGLFELEPDISSAARAAATAFKRVPRFQVSMRDLRHELASKDALRRSLAARALGVLHDREAVEGLIGLTGSVDQMCAQAAAEALKEITRAAFGTEARRWTLWWAEHRGQRRIEWLVAALRNPEPDLRQAAIEELARQTNATLGFEADGLETDREAAVAQWEALIHQPRWQRYDVA